MAPKQKTGEQFLHERDQNLHRSREVEDIVAYLRENGERIPNEPSQKIKHYLGFLANERLVNDGLLTGDKESIERQIESLIIQPNDVPESYFDLQRRIARERGFGAVEFDADTRKQQIDAVRSDQRASLEDWANYLTDPANQESYPDWFRKYAFEGMLKLGKLENGEFRRRSRSTTEPFAELNAEALGLTLDYVTSYHIAGERTALNEDSSRILDSGNFGKIYALALRDSQPKDHEKERSNIGRWRKFEQIGGDYEPDYGADEHQPGAVIDDPIVRALAESLRGHGTGWCTAGYSTAAHQLSQGDFYVFYTQDAKGQYRKPRLAIRMAGDKVAEVRGVAESQNIDSGVTDEAVRKLSTLPGGGEYVDKANDMARVTAIEQLVEAGEPLSASDLAFIYGVGLDETGNLAFRMIQGFGNNQDPRVAKIREKRKKHPDLFTLMDVLGVDINKFLDAYEADVYDDTTGVNDDAKQMIHDSIVMNYETALKQAGVDPQRILAVVRDCPMILLDIKARQKEFGVRLTNDDIIKMTSRGRDRADLKKMLKNLPSLVERDPTISPDFLGKLYRNDVDMLLQKSKRLLRAYDGIFTTDEVITQMTPELSVTWFVNKKYHEGFVALQEAGMSPKVAAGLFAKTTRFQYGEDILTHNRFVRDSDGEPAEEYLSMIYVDIDPEEHMSDFPREFEISIDYAAYIDALNKYSPEYVKFASEHSADLYDTDDDKLAQLRTMAAPGSKITPSAVRKFARDNGLMEEYRKMLTER